ncbi:MAG: type II 3-dehydroquinate dehydratase [Gemmatimonadetes bacterium]|nr:type II 3-dehydroquinate dehydratase [Gemmatimonadota bacterium]
MRIAIVHGPNLNLLGVREPEIYGRVTLAELNERIRLAADELGVEVETFQSNSEGALIDYVQEAAARVSGYIVNAGGYTHTSVALLDALTGVSRPFVEVHVSNLSAREPFRQKSLLAPKASGVVMGFGPSGYILALRGLVGMLGADA